MTERTRKRGFLWLVGPGVLVAATGVGAGDLASAGFAGSKLGMAVLWAVVVGAFFKFVLTEGLARWQLASGTTLLEGVGEHFGRMVIAVFVVVYFLPWTYFTAGAMVSACGVAAQSIVPIRTTFGGVFDSADQTGKVVYGAAHGLAGLALVLLGGFKLFERVMAASIGLMFVTVVSAAVMMKPDVGEVLRGLFVPGMPRVDGGLTWTVALMGGIGGTVTMLSYGYWIRETGRDSASDARICRIDLAVGYAMTGLFGVALIVIASGISVDGRGMGLIVALSEQIGERSGTVGKWLFLLGAWGAVFSSLLGVWQSVPYLFADCWQVALNKRTEEIALSRTRAYRIYLVLIATVPLAGLLVSFRTAQKAYTVVGAGFLPMLALALLILTTRRAWMKDQLVTRWRGAAGLVIVLLFASWAGVLAVRTVFAR